MSGSEYSERSKMIFHTAMLQLSRYNAYIMLVNFRLYNLAQHFNLFRMSLLSKMNYLKLANVAIASLAQFNQNWIEAHAQLHRRGETDIFQNTLSCILLCSWLLLTQCYACDWSHFYCKCEKVTKKVMYYANRSGRFGVRIVSCERE